MPDLAHPWVLLLLLPVFVFGYWRVTSPARVLDQMLPEGFSPDGKTRSLPPFPWFLRLASVGCLVISLAGPRRSVTLPLPPGQGVAVILAMDLSGSMETPDMGGQTRLEIARQEVSRFIRERPHDRLGLVTFGEEAITRVPPTSDHRHLQEVLSGLEISRDENGTAMGAGLGLAAQRILQVQSPSRVVVLITDGRNNTGILDPLPVARTAGDLGVRIHTVGVGGDSGEDALDEALLGEVAQLGRGRYFRASDPRGFRSVMESVDQMEKGPVAQAASMDHQSLHAGILLVGVLLLLAEGIFWAIPSGRIL